MYPILDVENSNSENPDFLGGWASQTCSEFQWFFLGTNPAISGCLLVDSRSRWAVAKCFPLSSQCHDTTDIHLEFPRNILPWFHKGWKFNGFWGLPFKIAVWIGAAPFFFHPAFFRTNKQPGEIGLRVFTEELAVETSRRDPWVTLVRIWWIHIL